MLPDSSGLFPVTSARPAYSSMVDGIEYFGHDHGHIEWTPARVRDYAASHAHSKH